MLNKICRTTTIYHRPLGRFIFTFAATMCLRIRIQMFETATTSLLDLANIITLEEKSHSFKGAPMSLLLARRHCARITLSCNNRGTFLAGYTTV